LNCEVVYRQVVPGIAMQPACIATGIAGRKLADDWGCARNFTGRNLTGSLILHAAPRRDLWRFGIDDSRL
jgi:hypothetical protein